MELSAVVDALGSRDHLERLRARQWVSAQSAAEVAARALRDTRPNAVAEGVRLVHDFKLLPLLGEVQALLEPRRPVRVIKASVWCLGRLGCVRSLEPMSQFAVHPNAMLRRAVMESAGRLGAGARGLLMDGLRDEAWQVRMDAATGLGGLEASGETLGRLVEAVRCETHPGTAERMVRAMADLGLKEAAPWFVLWLRDSSSAPQVRRAAARGLGELGVYDAVLEHARDDADAQVAEQADWSLRRVTVDPAGKSRGQRPDGFDAS